jgi:hypothetical protein
LIINADVCDILNEHTVEKLDVIRCAVVVVVVLGQLDGGLSVVVRGVENVTLPCTARGGGGGRGPHGGHGER